MQHLNKFHFAEDELKKLEAISQNKIYEPEELIIKEGERDRSLLVIKSGKVKVVAYHDNNPKVVAILATGTLIGELNFTIPLHRTADVVATENTEVLIFNYDKLCELLDADDELAVKFFEGINLLLIERLYKMI